MLLKVLVLGFVAVADKVLAVVVAVAAAAVLVVD